LAFIGKTDVGAVTRSFGLMAAAIGLAARPVVEVMEPQRRSERAAIRSVIWVRRAARDSRDFGAIMNGLLSS
jgi:hypothetical protein